MHYNVTINIGSINSSEHELVVSGTETKFRRHGAVGSIRYNLQASHQRVTLSGLHHEATVHQRR